MSLTVSSWSIPGADGQPILGNTHRPADDVTPRGTLICCHGFKGYKDYGFIPRLADHAANAGFIAHRFNFSHSGMTENIETFEKPQLFEKDTWSKQVYDIECVVRKIAEAESLPVVLFGHSRGGVSSLLAAAKLGERISGVVTAASPADACTLDEAQRGILRKTGRMASPSGRTGQTLYVGGGWLEEIENHPAQFDPVAAADSFSSQHGFTCFIHGDDDATVPLDALRRYMNGTRKQPAHIVSQANHTFNAPNPLPADAVLPSQTSELFEWVIRFTLFCLDPAAE